MDLSAELQSIGFSESTPGGPGVVLNVFNQPELLQVVQGPEF